MSESLMEKEDEAGGGESRRLVAEYEARLAEVAELAAHVRHEINNPLTGLLGQAQLLLREDLSDTARRRVETIEHLALRIRDTAALLREVQHPPADRTQADRTQSADATAAAGERETHVGDSEPPLH
jgi:signal transduction histidine kinase